MMARSVSLEHQRVARCVLSEAWPLADHFMVTGILTLALSLQCRSLVRAGGTFAFTRPGTGPSLGHLQVAVPFSTYHGTFFPK